jgi:heme exporter protein CcmD
VIASLTAGFWHMSGYAPYVWGSFGFAAAIFLWNWWAPRVRRRRLIETVHDE